MEKITERFKGLFEKFKGLSLLRRVIYSGLVIGIIIAIVTLSLYATTTKYSILFKDMDANDSKTILDKLTAQKTPYKVQGTSILVPDSQVENLRLSLATSVTNGSKGFELFDSSQLGLTDQEMGIKYQRALEGELERTLKGLEQVEGARVHLVMQQDTAFVKDTNPATASVSLKLKSGANLTKDQVKAMVAVICGSVKDLKKENVEIIDNNMRLLTDNTGDNTDSQTDQLNASKNQLTAKTQMEEQLKQKILEIVKPIAKNGNVKVTVAADMNFDATQVDSKVVVPGSKVSEQTETTKSTNGGTSNSGLSTVDNNTGNTYPATGATTGGTYDNNKATVNYENGTTETKTVVAPKIQRLTASVIFDGNLSDADKATYSSLISNAIGIDPSRNDALTVASAAFDKSQNSSVASDIAAISAENQKKMQQRLAEYIGIAVGAVIVLGIIGLSLRKKKSKSPKGIEELEEGGLNVLINDEIEPKDLDKGLSFEPIDFEPKNERTHVENEIRNYAKNKPDQVADIVKAWLADEER